ncbi:MAG TPA: hypothetical protein G4N92_00345 [Anaerolineae bacterium]|nr:hypothetical protein [Anaerolineae bacterium]
MNAVPFMKSPEINDKFHVGDAIEAYCDHIVGKQRIRGWLKGTVAQVDPKMIAIQFNTNVYLTGGWMVPDRVLWYPHDSTQIRKKRRSTRK